MSNDPSFWEFELDEASSFCTGTRAMEYWSYLLRYRHGSKKVDVGTSDENSGGKRQHQPHTIPQQPQPQPIPQQPQPQGPQPSEPTTFGVHNLPYDPADRPKITTYGANEVEEIRREYWVKGPGKPREHLFPKTIQFGKHRLGLTIHC
ncbi:hypothetical protein LXL04_008323 [Taraxacum kok-saghyz]